MTVHPKTGAVFLSAVDSALFVVDRTGALRATHFFAAGQLPKAEGITFLENGDPVLASEAVNTPPRLQVFRWSAPSATADDRGGAR